MEFHQKLQELRKQKGLTQEELAAALYVSRTAVSKWESGRGYPNIDSLKAIAAFFGVTVDTLLSGDQLLNIAEADNNKDRTRLTDLVFGLLDLSSLVFLFLPPLRPAGGRYHLRSVPAGADGSAGIPAAGLLCRRHRALRLRYPDPGNAGLRRAPLGQPPAIPFPGTERRRRPAFYHQLSGLCSSISFYFPHRQGSHSAEKEMTRTVSVL